MRETRRLFNRQRQQLLCLLAINPAALERVKMRISYAELARQTKRNSISCLIFSLAISLSKQFATHSYMHTTISSTCLTYSSNNKRVAKPASMSAKDEIVLEVKKRKSFY